MSIGGMGGRYERKPIEHVKPIDENRHVSVNAGLGDHATVRKVKDHPQSEREDDKDEEQSENEFEWLDSDVSAPENLPEKPESGEYHSLDVKV